MSISSLPGYLQGFIFSDDSSATYDAGTFVDQAGWGAANSLPISIGTPSFVTVNGQKGLTLDNTVQGRFQPACPWRGSIITVMRATGVTVNGTVYPVLIGESGTVTVNGSIRIVRANASTYSHRAVPGLATAAAIASYTDNGLKVSAFAFDQQTRIGYSTLDGVTVTASAPVADTGNGNALAIGAIGNTGAAATTVGQTARFGNLSGTIGDVGATTNTMAMFEIHFFRENLLISPNLTALAVEMAALKTKYGV